MQHIYTSDWAISCCCCCRRRHDVQVVVFAFDYGLFIKSKFDSFQVQVNIRSKGETKPFYGIRSIRDREK